MRALHVGAYATTRTGRLHRITARWRDPGMRAYEYEAEPVDAPGHPNTFKRGELTPADPPTTEITR